MKYEYSGYLRSLLYTADRGEIARVDAVEIGSEHLLRWATEDDDRDPEWRHIPAECERTPEGAVFSGDFRRVRQMDATGPKDPSFWVPLTNKAGDPGSLFPIDATRYPIIEITYRCRTEHCRPAWQWYYPGGQHLDGLQPEREWTTVGRLMQHRGFPATVTGLTLRLYAVARETQEWEIKSIRFRALTPAEAEAVRKDATRLGRPSMFPKHYPLLDNFVPLGVSVSARVGRQMANLMEMPFRDYWRLAMEDIARGHHNCLQVEHVDELTVTETTELLGLAASYGLRVIPILNWSAETILANGEDLVERYVRPHAESDALLAWCLESEPPEHAFEAHCKAKGLFEDADESHPLAALTRDPNSMALFSPHFAVSGLSYFKSGDPWQLGECVRTHAPLGRGQQFWVTAPAYIYATGTPRWNTCPEMRLMINHAFGNGARGWFTYSYHNVPIWVEGPFKRSLTGPFLTFSDLWIELSHRVERFNGLANLLLHTRPGDFWVPNIKFSVQPHPNSRLPEGLSPVTWTWLHGEDFGILYVINNDINEVTGVNIEIPAEIPFGQEAYDMTDFVRSREWRPTPRFRHLEMFPGQGQMIMFAPEDVAVRERDRVIAALIEDDRRRLGLEMGLARRYDLDISEPRDMIQRIGLGRPIDDLQSAKRARDRMTNMLYTPGPLVEARSAIYEISAALCGCDGALCWLYDRGRVDEAHERGTEVLVLSQRLNQLRLKMRRGHAADIIEDCHALKADTVKALGALRDKY
jgi:hypothetical protein